MNAWTKYYPPDVFSSIWQKIEALIGDGRLVAIDEVRTELSQQDDELKAWAISQPNLFVPLDNEIQLCGREIINSHPTLVNTGSVMSGSADPFVIALAQVRNWAVVHAENEKPTKPRIPDVCKIRGIEQMSMVQLFKAEGWRV